MDSIKIQMRLRGFSGAVMCRESASMKYFSSRSLSMTAVSFWMASMYLETGTFSMKSARKAMTPTAVNAAQVALGFLSTVQSSPKK